MGGLTRVVRRPRLAWLERTVTAVIATAGLALFAAACGGSTGNHVAQLSSTATPASNASPGTIVAPAESLTPDSVAYSACMRAHGISDFPDPGSSGQIDVKTTGIDLNTFQFQSANSACEDLLPNSGRRGPSPAEVQQVAAQALQFSQCVRAHDVTNFPDPDGSGRIPDPAAFGIDQGSPQFQAANEACKDYRPPYIPSNADFNSWKAGGS